MAPLRSPSSEVLGFAPGDRVLLVTADDMGMYPGVNRAVVQAFDAGGVTATSLLTVAAGTDDAIARLRARPDLPVGVHLTLVSESATQRWAPRAAPQRVPSLLDPDGCFPVATERERILARAHVDDVEREMRAQLAVVLDAGLAPTHLDWHCLADGGRDDLTDLTLALALEHGLAARVWLPAARARARARGLPVVDHGFLDSFALDVKGKAEQLRARLRALPAGLTEWAVHPGDDDAHSRALDPHWPVRHGDLRALIGLRAAAAEEGVVLADQRTLRAGWVRAAR